MLNMHWMNSFCDGKGLVTGFLMGVCVTYLFLAVGGPISARLADGSVALWNRIDGQTSAAWLSRNQGPSHCDSPLANDRCLPTADIEHNSSLPQKISECRRGEKFEQDRIETSHEMQSALLLALWEASSLLAVRSYDDAIIKESGLLPSQVPLAPHLENCEVRVKTNERLDTRGENGAWPPWILFKGQHLGLNLPANANEEWKEEILGNHQCTVGGPYPPWIEGADEDNLPMTRRVQHDIWLHQHPQNCEDPSLKFLLTDWEIDPGFGMGAQFAAMAGMLAIAINEQRVLVTDYFNRANHEGCVGTTHSHWSCYFSIETSQACRDHSLILSSKPSAWEQGLITCKDNYTSRQIWTGKIPEYWGKPWEQMQPTTQIDGKLLMNHKARDRRWWRAQAVRYLMRFPSKYTCSLLNLARHQAFGSKAAAMVLDMLPHNWPKVGWMRTETEIEHFVWSVHKPWIPRPMLSIHVRQGDKAREMEIVGFKSYMSLAQQLRNQFPNVQNIWLSTEMQDVIEQSKSYFGWNFHYTNITRQVGNVSMPAYEASLGRGVSTNYPLVNFLIAADADFFIGALGSTWCYLIDGMRSTGGKVMSGYLSVNKYRFW
eukprot:c18861_g1_i1 orf=471-2273(-)